MESPSKYPYQDTPAIEPSRFRLPRKRALLIGVFLLLVVIFLGAVAYWYLEIKNTHAPDLSTLSGTEEGLGYSFEGGKVFYEGRVVMGADISTFEILTDPNAPNTWDSVATEAKDANHFYIQGTAMSLSGPGMSTLDLKTLSKVAPGIFKDRYSVYTINDMSDYDEPTAEVVIVSGADPMTFVALTDPTFDSTSTYAKDKYAVYSLSGGYNPDIAVTKIPGIDPNTFNVIGHCIYPAQPSGPYGHGYAGKDSTYVIVNTPFSKPEFVSEADASTFEIIGEVPSNEDGLGAVPTVYAADKNHVYRYCSEIVRGVSPAECTANNLKGCEVSTKGL